MKCNKQYQYISKISNLPYIDSVSKCNPRGTYLLIIKQLPRCLTFFKGTLTNHNLEYLYYGLWRQPIYLKQHVFIPWGIVVFIDNCTNTFALWDQLFMTLFSQFVHWRNGDHHATNLYWWYVLFVTASTYDTTYFPKWCLIGDNTKPCSCLFPSHQLWPTCLVVKGPWKMLQ